MEFLNRVQTNGRQRHVSRGIFLLRKKKKKKYPTGIKEKMKDDEVVFAQPISTRSRVKHSKPSVNTFLFLLGCTSIYLYSSFQLLFIVSIRISLTTFSRQDGAHYPGDKKKNQKPDNLSAILYIKCEYKI